MWLDYIAPRPFGIGDADEIRLPSEFDSRARRFPPAKADARTRGRAILGRPPGPEVTET